MAKFANLDGTLRENFQIGPEEGTGFRRNSNGELALYDPETGLYTLAELVGGGGSADFGKLLFNRDGGLIYDNDGDVLLKKGL